MSGAKKIPLERLDLETMASGEQSIRLTERVTWEAFPDYAEAVVSLLGGTVVSRSDSAVERVWEVTIRESMFWIGFDDFALGVSLTPKNSQAACVIPEILDTLRGLSKG